MLAELVLPSYCEESSTMHHLPLHATVAAFRYSPFGIMCLIMGKILEIHDLADTARMLAMYMVTVCSTCRSVRQFLRES